MKKEVKIGIGVLAVALLGVGLYFYFKGKKKPKEEKKPEPDKNKKVFKDAYDNLVFEFNKDVIKPISFPYLNELADVMRETDWDLKLNGHTDNVGSAEYNLQLSKKRAEAVKKYLENQGIKPDRITAEGLGSTKPIADNKTEGGRSKNRRVEFIIVKKESVPTMPETPTQTEPILV